MVLSVREVVNFDRVVGSTIEGIIDFFVFFHAQSCDEFETDHPNKAHKGSQPELDLHEEEVIGFIDKGAIFDVEADIIINGRKVLAFGGSSAVLTEGIGDFTVHSIDHIDQNHDHAHMSEVEEKEEDART